jgi:transcription elongation factor Elf1
MSPRSETKTDTAAERRLATYDKNNCPQCNGWLLAPTWSEYLSERCVRHTWSCDVCGYEFETAVIFSAAA